jgi:hypothetical protein
MTELDPRYDEDAAEIIKKTKGRCKYIYTESDEASSKKGAVAGARCEHPIHSENFCFFHSGLLKRSQKIGEALERFDDFVMNEPLAKDAVADVEPRKGGGGFKSNKGGIKKRVLDMCHDELEGLRKPMREGEKWAWDALTKVMAVVTNPKSDTESGKKSRAEARASKEFLDSMKSLEDNNEQTN